MIYSGNECIGLYDSLDVFAEKQIVLYGFGEDGHYYWRHHNKEIDLIIDNGKAGKEIEGVRIIPVYEFLKLNSLDQYIILICGRRNFMKLLASLENKFELGKQLFIVFMYDSRSINKFVSYVKNACTHTNESCLGEVLIPIVSGDRDPVMHWYLIRYLRKRYHAKITVFDAFRNTEFNEQIINSEIVGLYKALGVTQILDCGLTEEQYERAQKIYRDISQKITTFEDWRKAEINGESYADQVLLEYLRYYKISSDPDSLEFHRCLYAVIERVIFWNDYFQDHDIKCLITSDGVIQERCIANIACKKNIPAYIFSISDVRRLRMNFCYEDPDRMLKRLYNQLSDDEKDFCVKWGRKQLDRLWKGDDTAILNYREGLVNIFASDEAFDLDRDGNRLGVLILPHIFNEAACIKDQFFHGNYIEWLLYLGEMSEKTDYNWYVKMHPDETERGENFYKEYLAIYKRIRLIPKHVSPKTFVKSGIRFALTMRGSAGHEYPYAGIHVINTGNNPHISFNFNINPQNEDEYKQLISNLAEIEYKADTEELCAFFGFHNLVYERFPVYLKNAFFDAWYSGKGDGYSDYLNYITPERNVELENIIEDAFESADRWNDMELHKKTDFVAKMISGKQE